MDLKHYPRGRTLFDLDRARAYDQDRRYDKPDGLWVSVKGDRDWQEWTQSEDFSADTTVAENEYSVHLSAAANLLHLTSSRDVYRFTGDYQLEVGWGSSFNRGYRIDWSRVAGEYDGIVIAPYQWECRLDDRTFWYYGWDCASGCIWNLDAIATVTSIHVDTPRAGVYTEATRCTFGRRCPI